MPFKFLKVPRTKVDHIAFTDLPVLGTELSGKVLSLCPKPHHPFPNLFLGLLQNLLMSFANSNKGGQPRERMGGEFAG